MSDAISGLSGLVNTSVSQTAFIGDVEKHLDDYRKGKGNLSKEIAGELGRRDDAVAIQLGQSNVRALTLYSTYGAAFSYDKRARFIEGTSYSVNQIQKIVELNKQAKVA